MSAVRPPSCYAVLRGPSAKESPIDRLIAAVRNSDHHELIDPPAGTRDRDLDWRWIVEDDRIDAVLIRGEDAATLDAVRQLVIRGKPVVMSASPNLPPEFVTEMSLYEAEGASTLLPWFEHRRGIIEAQRVLIDSSLGELHSLQIDRPVTAEIVRHPQMLTEDSLVDIDTLRLLGGDYSQVTCIRSGGGSDGYLTQTLQLSGPDLPDATCIHRRADAGSARLRIDGADDTTELILSDECAARQDDRSNAETLPHPQLVDELDQLWTSEPAAPHWSDLTRIYEIAEAAQRSLKRRRTIDLHFETTSERSQFKTHMATIGCGVILWTLFGLIGLLFAGGVLDPRDSVQRASEAAGFVVTQDEFAPDSASLTPAGEQHVSSIAAEWNQSETVVYIEAVAPAGLQENLDEQRRLAVWSQLAEAGADDPHRVVVRPIRGRWFAPLMHLARILVFAPVGLFLLVQLLLLITKPAAANSSRTAA